MNLRQQKAGWLFGVIDCLEVWRLKVRSVTSKQLAGQSWQEKKIGEMFYEWIILNSGD